MKDEENIYASIAELKREEIKVRESILSHIDELKAYIQMKLESLYAELSQRLSYKPELVAQYIPVKLHDDLARWQRSCGIKEFDPNQPRGPNGQWTSGDGNNSNGGNGSGNEDDSNDNSPEVFQSVDELSTNEKGVELIKQFEKFRGEVYLDQGKRPTIGYGHLLQENEQFPNGISKDEALKLLAKDIQTAENAIIDNVEVKLSQHKFDALTSFVFNEGEGNLRKSTLLKLLNEGKYTEAADEFPKWNKVTVDGVKVPSAGLSRRRAHERKLFLEGTYE